ncbi:MAG TPA: alpha/beta hydrolase [Vicinamibacterales bacterium]|nr:alpha/beta hydrolase [Vicinamibacterales bacterium]
MGERSRVRTWLRRIWVVGGISFTAWLAWNLQSRGVAASITESTDAVTVVEEAVATYFTPQRRADRDPVVVFVPGGLVDPRAYLPIVRRLADEGTAAALVEMPFRAALSESQREQLWQRIRDAHRRLGAAAPMVLAGHSRGAAMAARFAAEHPAELAGLVLVGTTHPRDQDLSGAPYLVLKVAGTQDCVAPLDDARANAAKLPPATEWVVIDGANHAQFGYYGSQINDCRAHVSRETQQRQLLDGMSAFVARVRDR